MFGLTRSVPFGPVWGWHASLGHPILKLFGLVIAVLASVVLIAVALVALIIDIILLPFRLLL